MPTGEPAAGAKVRIVPANGSSERHEVEVTTDTRGQFHRGEETQWTMVLLLPLDAIAREFVATAFYAGLESAPSRFGGGITNPHHFGLTNKSESVDLGDLVLHEGKSGR